MKRPFSFNSAHFLKHNYFLHLDETAEECGAAECGRSQPLQAKHHCDLKELNHFYKTQSVHHPEGDWQEADWEVVQQVVAIDEMNCGKQNWLDEMRHGDSN